MRVSVPLSGLSFLIDLDDEDTVALINSFRPLIGVIISNRTNKVITDDCEITVSVPLSGLSFLINK